GRERTAIRQRTARAYRGVLLRVDRTAVIDASRIDTNIATRAHLPRLHELPRRGQRQITRLRHNGPSLPPTDPVLGPDENDPVRVHTAELRHVDRHTRGRTASGNSRCT